MKRLSLLLGALFVVGGCAAGSDEGSDQTYGETDRAEKQEQTLQGAQVPDEELEFNKPRKDVREEIVNPIPMPGPQLIQAELDR
jgi:hypothetical protein